MEKYLIITNNNKEKNEQMVHFIMKAVEERGGTAEWVVMPPRNDRSMIEVAEGTKCIFTIGGDGTVIRSAQRTLGSRVPILGVNRGHLGYLCDLNEDNLIPAIDKLFTGDFETEERMMLSGWMQEDSEEKPAYALNDVVLSSLNGQSVVHLTIYINEMPLYSFNGDGLIIATPTGSTAYNLSAGGPIVEPGTDLILLTPINPHTINTRTIILDPKDTITVEITPRRGGNRETVGIAFDGVHRRQMHVGERLVVRRAKEQARMVLLDKVSFIERLQARLQMT